MSGTTTWFDEVITLEERVGLVTDQIGLAWAIDQFDRYLDVVLPTDLEKIG